MDGLEWIFDPVPPSGALSGGDPASYVFKPSIDTFVREVVQNSNDQRSGEEMVDVTFALHEFTGGHAAEAALSTVGWNHLVPHLEAVSETDSLIAGRVREAVDDASQGRLMMLAVSDRNTRGLYGEEMSTDGNFAPLCRHKLVTSDDKTLGGGSHGLGKAVLWSFSSISTVAFASVIDNDPGQTRYIARTELPYHDLEGTVWAGQGWYGVPEDAGQGKFAKSAWFGASDRHLHGSPMERPVDASGTTILIPFFFEPQLDDRRPASKIAESILESVSKWFWPSLRAHQLRVDVQAFQNGQRVFEQRAGTESPLIAPFVQSEDAASLTEKALEPLDVTERSLAMRPPTQKNADPPDESLEGEMALRVMRAAEDQTDHPLVNHVAVYRGAHMVVKYYRPKGLTVETSGFFGVLKAGVAHGVDVSDEQIERFLRAAEPPAHDDWIPSTNNLRSRFNHGGRARLEELWSGIDHLIADACRQQPPDGQVGPALLAKKFPLGARGVEPTPPKRRFTTTLQSSSPNPPNWAIVVKVERQSGTKPWEIRGKLLLEAESGPGQALTIGGLVADGLPESALTVRPEEIEVKVPGDMSSVVLHIVGHTAGIDPRVMRRTRLRANITMQEAV